MRFNTTFQYFTSAICFFLFCGISLVGYAQAPTITDFSPVNGPIGTEVTITGTGFDTTPTNNTVFFGATQSTVSAATASSLSVTVPSGASYMPITVLVNGLVGYASSPFVVTFGGAGINANSFAEALDFTTGSAPYSVAIGDLDGDGKSDLAVANISSNTVSVLRNTSTGTGTVSYAAKMDFVTNGSPISVAVGDLDGDGKLDLAVANAGNATLSIFRNTSTGAGMVSYDAKVDYTTGSSPYSVVIGDLDGDGKSDLAVANRGSSTLSTFRNTSTGSGTMSFAAKLDYTTGSTPSSIAMGDFDADGKPDLVVANSNDNTVSVLRNASAGAGNVFFDTKIDFITEDSPNAVAVGDLDGDGRIDLAVGNSGNDDDARSVSVLRNTSTGVGNISYDTKIDFTSGVNLRSVAIGDLDGDNKLDIVATGTGSGRLSIHRNTSIGDGNIAYAPKYELSFPFTPTSTAIGDLDGDGRADLLALTSNSSTNKVSIFRNIIASSATDFTAFSLAEQVSDATINATDHTIDVTVTAGTNLIALVPTFTLSNGASAAVGINAHISGTTSYNFTDPVTYTVIAENGTTTQDWVVTVKEQTIPHISDFSPTSGPIGTEVTITGTGFDTTPTNNIVFFGATEATVSAATATTLTVNVPSGATYQPITVLVGGLVAYASSPFVVTFGGEGIDATSFATKVDQTTGTAPNSVAIGDLDGDGKSDLVVANRSNNTVSILRNTSTGAGVVSYAAKVDYTTGANPISVAIGDLDGDGKSDLAVANIGGSTVSVFRNTSTGAGVVSYAAKVDYTTGTLPYSVSIGDLDGDGKSDLAVANSTSNTVSVFRNTSTGAGVVSYAAKVDYVTGSAPRSVAIGDLDGDGKSDLAVANYNSNSVSVFRNTSTGAGVVSYAAKVDYTTGNNPESVSIGDLDGDGQSDLVVANLTSVTVSVLRNTSTGAGMVGYAAKVDYTTGSGARSVSIGDLDGDGKLDLAVANYTSGTLSVLGNTSTGAGVVSYAAKVDYTTGTQPISVSIGDLDGDGKSDMVVANNGSSTVSVITNKITAAASTATDFTAFSITEQVSAATINATAHTIAVTVTAGTSLTALVPTFTLSSGASAVVGTTAQVSGTTANDFTSAVTYTVTAEDGTTIQDWVVTVTEESTSSEIPTITNFSPTSGPVNTQVTITGTGFDTTPANNIVFFGATEATVSAASASSLTVTVPSGATYQPITILTDGLIAYSSSPFLVTFGGEGIDSNSFESKADFTTGLNPFSVAIGDLDGDGMSDMATANLGSNTLSVFRNTSTGAGNVTYALKVDYDTGTDPYSVSIGDLNGDGKLDLVVPNRGSSTLSVFINTSTNSGSISFAARVDIVIGEFPRSVAIGD